MIRLKRLQKSLLSIALAIGISGSCLMTVPVGASLTDTRADAWGTEELAGNNWLGSDGVAVYSNGATAEGPSSDTYNELTLADGTKVKTGIKWQCVELAQRLYTAKRWYPGMFSGVGSAYQIYDKAVDLDMERQANGQVTSIVPGDMFILSGNTHGHVGIVDRVDDNNNGTKKVTIVNQNTKAVYTTSTWNIAAKTLTNYLGTGYTVSGIVHDPDNGGTSSTPPPVNSTNRPVPGDFNGDGKTDRTVFRPSTGYFHVDGVASYRYGESGDIPVPADYNGDGVTDVATYRPSHGGWHIRGVGDYPYGWATDIPVPGDYNGDGITDMAVYRSQEGGWHIRGVGDWPHGWATDVPVPGRFDADKSWDSAIYRPSDGGWRIRAVGDYPWGWATDVPAIQTLNAQLLKQYGLIQDY